MIYLDSAEAFDKLDRKILLRKLYRYGIKGKAYNLINNYLSEREQLVKIYDLNSIYKEINVGIASLKLTE